MATTNFNGELVSLAGKQINVGDKAPCVKVTIQDLSEIEIGGKRQILVVVPSLDTPVCADEARKFNEEIASLNIEVVVISMDLPFAIERFCTTEGIEDLKVASDFRNKDFANAYGVLIASGLLTGVMCRAIFIIDKQGIVIYKEICPEITKEPDYEAVFAATNQDI